MLVGGAFVDRHVVDVALSAWHSLAVTSDGFVFAFGGGRMGSSAPVWTQTASASEKVTCL